MSAINKLRQTTKQLKASDNRKFHVRQELSIRVKNGVAVITGLSPSSSVRNEAERVVSQLSSVSKVINLSKVDF